MSEQRINIPAPETETQKNTEAIALGEVLLGYDGRQSYARVFTQQAAPIVNRLLELAKAGSKPTVDMVIAQYSFTEDPADVLNDERARRDYLTATICDLAKAAGLYIRIDGTANRQFGNPGAFADVLLLQAEAVAKFPLALKEALENYKTETEQGLQSAREQQQKSRESQATEPASQNEEAEPGSIFQSFRRKLAAIFPSSTHNSEVSEEKQAMVPETPDFILKIYAENASRGLFGKNKLTHTISLVAQN